MLSIDHAKQIWSVEQYVFVLEHLQFSFLNISFTVFVGTMQSIELRAE